MWKQHLVQLFCAAFQACCTGVHYSCDPELSSFYAHIYGHCDHSFITVVISPSWVLFRVVVLTRLEHICTSFHIISRKHSHKYQYLTVAHVMSCFSKISQSILLCTTLLLLLLWFSCFARWAALFYSIDASLFTIVLVNIYWYNLLTFLL